MTEAQKIAHLAHLKALADKYEAEKFGFKVIDRTPAGFGPKE